MFENMPEPSGILTEKLLKAISNRLSGREDCKKLSYLVTIDHTGVKMNPLVQVYPNKHKRKESDLIDIISFIHASQFNNVELTDLIFGVYAYDVFEGLGKRRWRRLS